MRISDWSSDVCSSDLSTASVASDAATRIAVGTTTGEAAGAGEGPPAISIRLNTAADAMSAWKVCWSLRVIGNVLLWRPGGVCHYNTKQGGVHAFHPHWWHAGGGAEYANGDWKKAGEGTSG